MGEAMTWQHHGLVNKSVRSYKAWEVNYRVPSSRETRRLKKGDSGRGHVAKFSTFISYELRGNAGEELQGSGWRDNRAGVGVGGSSTRLNKFDPC